MENNKDVEVIEEETKQVKEESKKEKKEKKENKKDKQIEELQNEINILKDKNIRVTADMVNTLRRKDEENSRMMKYANESLILELLLVVDNFERALNIEGNSKDDNSGFLKGMNMIYSNLNSILEKYEVKEIEAYHKEFDPSVHQAVMQGEEEGTPSNIVIEVMQKGYTYKDKVIRPAMVKVNK